MASHELIDGYRADRLFDGAELRDRRPCRVARRQAHGAM
jgi:hypothetical protein